MGFLGADAMLFALAWIVLIILIVCTTAVIVFLAMLPGMIAKKRKHPWEHAVTIAGWVTLFFGFALWPLALVWAYVDVPMPYEREAEK
jgi:small neutral amino acid transporter SnatA (MarC family)